MESIDEIMDMLDWNNPPEVQERGRMLARNIRCINVFLQPGHPGHGKNVWDNCALILAERTDQELHPYLFELFEWLSDMNWPGAICIFERLLRYQEEDWLNSVLSHSIKEAQLLCDECWLDYLLEFQQSRQNHDRGFRQAPQDRP